MVHASTARGSEKVEVAPWTSFGNSPVPEDQMQDSVKPLETERVPTQPEQKDAKVSVAIGQDTPDLKHLQSVH